MKDVRSGCSWGNIRLWMTACRIIRAMLDRKSKWILFVLLQLVLREVGLYYFEHLSFSVTVFNHSAQINTP
jgi:hypothetical protein